MKKFLTKNKFTYVLIAAVVLLWGFIIFNIVGYINSGDESSVNDHVNKIKLPAKSSNIKFKRVDIDTLTFTRLNKNPFVFEKRIVKVSKIIKPKFTLPPPPTINFNISGVIINENKKLVVFNDLTNNKTVFLSEGDKYKDIKIKSIDVEKVTYLENNQEKVIQLKR
jgi:hypothetical protein